MRPTIGRIVHVVWPDGVESPAIVTRTKDDTMPGHNVDHIAMDEWRNTTKTELDEYQVDLMVFGLTRVYPLYSIYEGDGAKTWHWPERD